MAARTALHSQKSASDRPALPTCAALAPDQSGKPTASACAPQLGHRGMEPSDKYGHGVNWVGPGGAPGRGAGYGQKSQLWQT